MVDNIYATAFNGMANVISNLESYKDAPGINISNWITQIIGNSPIGYAFTIKLMPKGGKMLGVKIAKNFSPVGGHRDCPNYLGLMRAGKFDKLDVEFASLLGYIIAGLWLGKPLAIVNAGRGLAIEKAIKDLTLTDVSLVIHDFSTGGKDKPHDVDVNFNEIKSKAHTYALRAERIKALPKREGHAAVGKIDLGNRAKVEVIS
jgi:hypothetical protein